MRGRPERLWFSPLPQSGLRMSGGALRALSLWALDPPPLPRVHKARHGVRQSHQ
jgi:hypothetical protein